MKRKTIAGLLLALLAIAAPALAHDRTALDDDDSAGPLDIVAARATHRNGAIQVRVVTYEEWSDATLSGALNYVRFDLTKPGRYRVVRCVVIRVESADGEDPVAWQGSIYKDCRAPLPYANEIGSVRSVVRPDAHSLRAVVDAATVWKNPSAAFDFRAVTSFEDEDHPRCQPPNPVPPEHFLGTCWDVTSWRRHN
ncbi:MAG: hypothetical protein M3161_02980 [Actinomycetota bacterium]|nr:hypothetical protein [Actinomycetota bacterium]